jgi:aryl-alcohol dehydrogenase-like predicted oxidoreductase
MSTKTAAASGTFQLLGERAINRLGFGAMRLTGPGVWGPPEDVAAAAATLRRARDLGVELIDTADSYGPFTSEELIRQTLHPYKGLLIATKGGLTRPGPSAWLPSGRPEYLRRCVEGSLRRLQVERIDLWQLHRIDPNVPRGEQFDVMAQMRKEGLISMLGLSEVSVDDIEAAQRYFPVATVQNRYNLVDRGSEDVLDYCDGKGIGFIPWFPLASGQLAQHSDSALSEIARQHRATPSQVALAWMLARARVMLPIPGTSNPEHVEQNVAGASLHLSDEERARLDREGAAA